MTPDEHALIETARHKLETGPQGLLIHDYRPQKTPLIGMTEVYRDNIEFFFQWTLHGKTPFEASFFIAQKPRVFAITDIFVPETHRGRGFGKEILSQLEELAQTLSIPVVEAHENTHRNQYQTWWEQRGYRLTSDGTYGGIWIMAKNFQKPAPPLQTERPSYLVRLSKSLFQH